VLGAYRMGDIVMASVQIDVLAGSPLAGKTVRDAGELLDAAVVGVRRMGQAASNKFSRDESLRPGDALVCHVAVEEIAGVKARASGRVA